MNIAIATNESTDRKRNRPHCVSDWTDLKTFRELCEQMAQFCEGTIEDCPPHPGPLEPESRDIAKQLAEINRGGFLTTCSQPGVAFSDHEGRYGQRAYVTGFVQHETAETLHWLLMQTDLYVAIFYPFEPTYRCGTVGEHRIPVTIKDKNVFTSLCNCNASAEEMAGFYCAGCDENAMQELSEALLVVVVDLLWGRPNYLFERVAKVLSIARSTI